MKIKTNRCFLTNAMKLVKDINFANEKQERTRKRIIESGKVRRMPNKCI